MRMEIAWPEAAVRASRTTNDTRCLARKGRTRRRPRGSQTRAARTQSTEATEEPSWSESQERARELIVGDAREWARLSLSAITEGSRSGWVVDVMHLGVQS